jgi:hypothetical protein
VGSQGACHSLRECQARGCQAEVPGAGSGFPPASCQVCALCASWAPKAAMPSASSAKPTERTACHRHTESAILCLIELRSQSIGGNRCSSVTALSRVQINTGSDRHSSTERLALCRSPKRRWAVSCRPAACTPLRVPAFFVTFTQGYARLRHALHPRGPAGNPLSAAARNLRRKVNYACGLRLRVIPHIRHHLSSLATKVVSGRASRLSGASSTTYGTVADH